MIVHQSGHPLHVSYCTNVHPGETWTETFGNLQTHVLNVRRRVCADRFFGLGLRLSDVASRELEQPDALASFKSWLSEQRLYLYTINGFPFGRFHSVRVKEQVFAPDWTRPERLEYTLRLARILATLLPETIEGVGGIEGSISTLPGSFGKWITRPEETAEIVNNLVDCAMGIERLAQQTGKQIHLGLEPEPFGLFEDVGGTIAFFEESLRPLGVERLTRGTGLSAEAALAILNRRIGICYDTCHMAVEYEDAAGSVQRLRAAGILISKVQVSSALRLRPGAESIAQLERFADGVYLHQVIARRVDGTLERWKDIAPALADRDRLEMAEELRVHCHVPLYLEGHKGLESTSDFIPSLLRALDGRNLVAHFELETYTWDVLPEALRARPLDEAIAHEFQWFLYQLAAAGKHHP